MKQNVVIIKISENDRWSQQGESAIGCRAGEDIVWFFSIWFCDATCWLGGSTEFETGANPWSSWPLLLSSLLLLFKPLLLLLLFKPLLLALIWSLRSLFKSLLWWLPPLLLALNQVAAKSIIFFGDAKCNGEHVRDEWICDTYDGNSPQIANFLIILI